MVNLGKEIEKEKRNERKLAPCMNVFINFLPYITLDLFHPKQWLQKRLNMKEIETWKVANRSWGGKIILKNDRCWKQTQFYGLRTEETSYGYWRNEIATIFSEKIGKQQEERIKTREKQSFS